DTHGRDEPSRAPGPRGGGGDRPSLRVTRARPAEPPTTFPAFTPARRTRAALVAGLLRSGRVVPDDAFDAIYPEALKAVSSIHFAPVGVAARVVELLALPPGAVLLDVGAGAGKFCIVVAAMSQARVRGLERRPELAEAAREAARRLGIAIEIIDG